MIKLRLLVPQDFLHPNPLLPVKADGEFGHPLFEVKYNRIECDPRFHGTSYTLLHEEELR